jgi:hypothetical protein
VYASAPIQAWSNDGALGPNASATSGDAVGQAGFLEQTYRKNNQATQDQMRIRPLRVRALELRDHVLVMKDRPRDQVRKIADEQRIMRQRIARDISPVGVDQECNLGERVERNPDGKQDIDGKTGRKYRVQIGGEEAGIFESAEHEKIAGDADGEDGKSQGPAQAARDQQQADEVIEGDRRQQ